MRIEVWVVAGAICGALDLLCATALYRLRGISFKRLLQFIASGALGESAFKNGKISASLGFVFHFLIAFVAAGVYYAASLQLAFLVTHFWIFGLLYGLLIHLTMTFIVLPLSGIAQRQFVLRAFLQQLLVHVFVVGLSISTVVHYFSQLRVR